MHLKAIPARVAVAVLLCGGALALSGCAATPGTDVAQAASVKSEIKFLDLKSFDKDLSQSLAAPLPRVDVRFYDEVTPSAMPERLQTWLSSVEAGGGRIKVNLPKTEEVAAKDPFLLITIADSIWTVVKMGKEALLNSQFGVAKGYDAEIILKEDAKGQRVVDSVVFVKRNAGKS